MEQNTCKSETRIECKKYILLQSLFSEKILNLISRQCKVTATQKMHKELHMETRQKA
jgi:hypothetical protein